MTSHSLFPVVSQPGNLHPFCVSAQFTTPAGIDSGLARLPFVRKTGRYGGKSNGIERSFPLEIFLDLTLRFYWNYRDVTVPFASAHQYHAPGEIHGYSSQNCQWKEPFHLIPQRNNWLVIVKGFNKG